MKVVGLLSGGKDSCYNLVQCVAAGHEVTCLANLAPAEAECVEADSHMYQVRMMMMMIVMIMMFNSGVEILSNSAEPEQVFNIKRIVNHPGYQPNRVGIPETVISEGHRYD